MIDLKNYPNERGYVKFAIEVTENVLASMHERNLPCGTYLEKGLWICVDVVENGYIIPPTANGIKSREEADKACDAHNSYCGYTVEEVGNFISKSMGLKTSC